jgi:hypothetical protein
MLQLEKELLEKQQLELEVARLNGTLQVMKHLEGDDDGDIHEKMEKLSERLEHEKKSLEDLSGDLVRKERESNDELQQARKELILVLLIFSVLYVHLAITMHLICSLQVDFLKLFFIDEMIITMIRVWRTS